jgi:hypothetical protein
MIRIAPVLTEIKSLKDSVHQRQWVIDLSSNSSSPIACTSQTMPPPQVGRAGLSFKKFGGKNNNNNSEEEDSVKYGTILPGGVVWSDHGGKSQDLIIITTTTVILYKISLSRNSAAKSHMFTHPLAIAFWYEPISRTLMLGSYSPNQSYYKNKLSKKDNINDLSLKEDKDSDSEEGIRHPPSVLVMRTFFLQRPPPDKSATSGVVSNNALLDEMNNSFNDSMASVAPSTEAALEGNSFFPRLELPPPDRVPPFATGLSRGVYHSAMHSQSDSSQSDEEEDMAEVVAANNVALVNIYGEPYCIEVGSLGHGRGITLYKLIKDGINSTLRVKTVVCPMAFSYKRILKGTLTKGALLYIYISGFLLFFVFCFQIPDNFSLPRTPFDSTLVYVVDNLLCIMSKEAKSTLFIDIKNMYYKSSNPKESMVVVEEMSKGKQPDVKSVYDEGCVK